METAMILLTHELPPDWLTTLSGKDVLVANGDPSAEFPGQLDRFLEEAQAILSLLSVPIGEDLIQRMPRLKVISNMAVGVDNIDLSACTRRGIPVGNTPEVLTEATADLTMALLLAIARNIPSAARDAAEGRWKTWMPAGWLGTDLGGAVLGIIGMGKIGKAVAARAHAFGMKIMYVDPHEFQGSIADRVTLDECLAQSDIISLHCPLTSETRGLINSSRLQLMKESALLVNVGRGPIVDTNALLQALQAGRIAGAALDVTDPEPLPKNHPLYQLPNCLIVPHIGSATRGTRKRMAEIACANILAGLEGRALPHCVNPDVYQNKNPG